MVNELKKIFKFWALMGLVPYNQHRMPQLWQKLYTIGLILFNLAIATYAIKKVPFGKELYISDFINRLVFVCLTIAFTTNMLEIMFNYDKHFAFLERSRRIKVLLRRELSAPIHWQRFHRTLLWKSIFYITTVFGGVGVGTYMALTESYVGYYGFATMVKVILRMRWLQLIIYANYVVIYQKTLNQRLNSLISSKILKQRAFLDISYKKLESLENLMAAKNCYKEILEFANIFSEQCGWSLLSLSVTIFVDMMINSYWTILIWEKFYIFSYIYITSSNVLAFIVIIFMFCYACELCKRESLATGEYMKRLLTAPSSRNLGAKIYNDLVKEFIIQVMQHPIHIGVKGFFNIDMELLMGAFAAILSYLVILLQFSISKREEKQV